MNCPKCGTDNRLGAIFCRNCGVKLDLDSVTSQTFEEKTGVIPKSKLDESKRKRKLIFNIVRLVLLLAFIYAAVLAFSKPAFTRVEWSRKDYENCKKKRQWLVQAYDRKRPLRGEFTLAEINGYIGALTTSSQNQKGNVRLDNMWVTFGDNDLVRVIYDVRIFGRPFILQYPGTLTLKDGRLNFKPQGFFSARVGKLPYPTPLMNRHVRTVMARLTEEKDFISKLSSVEIKDGKIVVSVKP